MLARFVQRLPVVQSRDLVLAKDRTKTANAAKNEDKNIDLLHSVVPALTPGRDTDLVERLIAIVHSHTDEIKKANDVSNSSLHILEESNTVIREQLAILAEETKEIDREFEAKLKKLMEEIPK